MLLARPLSSVRRPRWDSLRGYRGWSSRRDEGSERFNITSDAARHHHNEHAPSQIWLKPILRLCAAVNIKRRGRHARADVRPLPA
jgi:hypothetical protein